MFDRIKQELNIRVNDEALVENLFLSFQKISQEFIAQNPVSLLQNTGLFIEAALRVAEHFVLGNHTSLSAKFDIDNCIKKLEKASGSDGLRIHTARLARSIYDFRSRKKSTHLKAIDPQVIDANLVFNISIWILIEILKEGNIPNPEDSIRLLFMTKIPLVQSVGGILRTTNPNLSGPQRVLLLLYSIPEGLVENQLFEGTKQKIKDLNHLKTNLRNMDKDDLVHKLSDGRWVLFGRGFVEAEKLIKEFT